MSKFINSIPNKRVSFYRWQKTSSRIFIFPIAKTLCSLYCLNNSYNLSLYIVTNLLRIFKQEKNRRFLFHSVV